MPIYDYRCSDCKKTFETLVRGSIEQSCPECGSHHLEKLLSIPAPPVMHSSQEPSCPPGGCGGGSCRFS